MSPYPRYRAKRNLLATPTEAAWLATPLFF